MSKSIVGLIIKFGLVRANTVKRLGGHYMIVHYFDRLYPFFDLDRLVLSFLRGLKVYWATWQIVIIFDRRSAHSSRPGVVICSKRFFVMRYRACFLLSIRCHGSHIWKLWFDMLIRTIGMMRLLGAFKATFFFNLKNFTIKCTCHVQDEKKT